MKTAIYMDYHATTPLDPQVKAAMEPFLESEFGNAASKSHVFGWRALAAVEQARKQVAQGIGADPEEIIFTSGATESNNLALLGVARANRDKGRHLVTLATEHKAVLDPCLQLKQEGFSVTVLPVDRTGKVSLKALEEAIQSDTILISVMAANNEIGTLHPLAEIGALARDRKILFHSDAAQALGKIPLDVASLSLDLVSFSAHKVYGPKGVGALYVRRISPAMAIQPLLFGGGHETGLRSGTLNVPGVVGFGKAVAIAKQTLGEEATRVGELRDRLWRGLSGQIKGIHRNSPEQDCLAGNLNVSFDFVPSENLLMELKEVALSSGSACTSARPEPSHVLQAIGLSEARSKQSIRFGLGRFTTAQEVDQVVSLIQAAVAKIRENSLEYQMAQEGVDFKTG